MLLRSGTLLRAIDALDDPVLRELAGRVAVGKLLRENPSHAALRDRLLEFRVSGVDPEYYMLACTICKKRFEGPGHNPQGYAKCFYDKTQRRTRTWMGKSSRYGMTTGRCCSRCNKKVMRWRGQDSMP
jgi:hypothetical protein